MTKNDALAIIPINISKMEETPVNRTRRITVDEKKRLLEVYNKKMGENRALLSAKREEIADSIVSAAKEKANLDKYRKEVEDLEAQQTAIAQKINDVKHRCENTTGFTIDGTLLTGPGYRAEDSKSWLFRHKAGMAKADKIRNLIEIGQKRVDRFALKFDKVETRIILGSTIGEVMDIMDAVLGNGDLILQADPIEEEQE